MQSGAGATIEPGSFVELRGRPWLVEEVQGEADDLQTLTRRKLGGEPPSLGSFLDL